MYKSKYDLEVVVSNWLSKYVDEVIVRVLDKIDEIKNNDVAMFMLDELYERDQIEKKEFQNTIAHALLGTRTSTKFRFNSLSHADSYRDVLYDMYIKEVK